MDLRNERELDNTREKLRRLESMYAEVREAELESLQRMINQLKEEIARYEARQPARR